MNNMIDIHSHVIHCVDDGSPSLETSISLIKEEIRQGVKNIICTPHYRKGMFMTSKEDILMRFNELKDAVKKENLDVNLYLGQETYLHGYESLAHALDADRIYSMNGKNYLLIEFSYTRELDLSEIVYTARLRGFIPIIAHIERYQYVDRDKAREIVEYGGLIQINAASILGKEGHSIKSRAMKYLKDDVVSFISSDIHSKRVNYMEKAYQYILKKFGETKANKLFHDNACQLIEED